MTKSGISEPDSDNRNRPYGEGDASYIAAGCESGIRHLVDDFYAAMDTLPSARVIRAMHPEDLTVTRDKLTRFLCGWLGGPRLFREKYGPIQIPRAHSHLDIGVAERDAWLECMSVALEKQDYAENFREYLLRELFKPADRSRTRD